MSYHICSQCGFEESIFGSGGAVKLAKEKGIPLLGQLPLHINIRQDIDQGCPSVANPDSAQQAQGYFALAEQVVCRLYWQGSPKLDSINFVELR
jgi:ATP-binding protein involved in chromosome partitioning